jgi:hypothetical protein
MEEEVVARKVLIEQLFPLVREDLDPGPASRVEREFFASKAISGGTTQERAAGVSIPSYQTVDYPNSNAIMSTILMHVGWLETGSVEYVVVLEYIAELMRSLAEELHNR